MSDSPDLYPRFRPCASARAYIAEAITDMVKGHDLTTAEVVSILAAEIQGWIGVEIERERKPPALAESFLAEQARDAVKRGWVPPYSRFRHPFTPQCEPRQDFCFDCGGEKDHPIHHQGGTNAR